MDGQSIGAIRSIAVADSTLDSGDLPPPSPPAEKASARQDQAWKACTGLVPLARRAGNAVNAVAVLRGTPNEFNFLTPLLWNRHDVYPTAFRKVVYLNDVVRAHFSKKITLGQKRRNGGFRMYPAVECRRMPGIDLY